MRTTTWWATVCVMVGLGALLSGLAQDGSYKKTYNYDPSGQRKSMTSTADGKTTKTLYFYGPMGRLEKTVTVEVDPKATGDVLMLAGKVARDKNRYYLVPEGREKIELASCPTEIVKTLQANVGKTVQVAVQATVTETKGTKQTKVERTLAIHAP